MKKTLANRWIEIFSVGTQVDSEGRSHHITADFLDRVVSHYDPALHEAPAVVGHPKDNAPAYAWTPVLRVTNGILEAQFKDIEPNFEQAVIDGRLKKRSASFYLDPATAPGGRAPYLRHVGFLGAQPPAVKGLRDIQFKDGGESVTFDFSEVGMDEKQEQSLVNKITEAIKSAFPFLVKKDEGTQANFSEADRTSLIAAAVKQTSETLTAQFSEELKKRDTEIAGLRSRVDAQATAIATGDHKGWIEQLGPARLPLPARNGLVEFMESISGVEEKITVVNFSEKDGQKVETKTESSPLAFFRNFVENLGPFIEFGERFGGLHPSGNDLGTGVTPERKAELREKAGLPPEGGK